MRIGRAAAGSRIGTIGILMERAVWALSEAVAASASHIALRRIKINDNFREFEIRSARLRKNSVFLKIGPQSC